MIPASHRQHRVRYTDDGQIIIEPDVLDVGDLPQEVVRVEEETWDTVADPELVIHDEFAAEHSWDLLADPEVVRPEIETEDVTWETTNETEKNELEELTPMEEEVALTDEEAEPVELTTEKPKRITAEKTKIVLRQMRDQVHGVAHTILAEGTRQVRVSAEDGKRMSEQLAGEGKTFLQALKKSLWQPVWVPGRKGTPKKRSRAMLFATDVFRFGGTFAAIFVSIFIAMNYQSFWEIAKASVEPLSGSATVDELSRELEGSLLQDGSHILSSDGIGDTPLPFVPPVGPPENRIIIPSLNLNVPIVVPSNDPLIRQDWAALEQEIQHSLELGVAHYPGTARPGQAGNFFLTGHSSYYPWAPGNYKSVFARLSHLKVGEEYWVYYGGDKHRYVVQSVFEVKPTDVSVLDQPADKRYSTLMTCTPVGTTLRRLIVRAQEVDTITGEPLEVGEHDSEAEVPRAAVEMLPI